MESDVPRQQPVRADDQVHVPSLQPPHDPFGLAGGAEAGQHLDCDRIVGEPLPERAAVLLRENRRGGEHRDLLSGLHRLEGGTQRHLGLTVPDVADQQPIHRERPLHVALHFLGRASLIGCVFVQEGGLELALPGGVGREGEPGRDLATGVEIEELGRHLADGGPRFLPLALPGRRAEAVQLGRRSVSVARRAVRFELVQAVERHVEAVAAFVFDDRHLERPPFGAHRDRLDPAVPADTVLEMDHVVARLQRPGGRCGRLAVAPRPPQAPRPPEDLMIGEHAQRRQHEPAVQRSDGQRGRLGPQQLLQPLELSFVVAQNHGRRPGSQQPAQPLDVAVHRLGRAQREADRRVRRAEGEPRERRQARAPAGGVDKDVLSGRRLLAQSPGDLEVMFRLRPGAIHFPVERRLLIQHQQRIARQQIE